jgi:tetratricopeptide (TPR) repeat protein
MPQELFQLDSRRLLTRILFFLLILSTAVLSYYAARWYVGNTLAEYFNVDENNVDLAKTAVTLAPNDPLTHWTLGQVLLKGMPLDQMSVALPEYEKAIALSPNDYRLWNSLGVARQRVGEADKAEEAFRQAIKLAPSYAYPHWYLGNLLLRAGRYDEAFVELRIASDGDPQNLRPQFFNLIWQVYDNDLTSITKALGGTAGYKVEFAQYQIAQRRFDEGLKIWNTLSPEEKKSTQYYAGLMIKDLLGGQRFHDAATMWNEIAGGSRRVQEGQISDGGFEVVVARGSEGFFDWQVKNEPGVQIGIDTAASHGGTRSLRLLFNVRSNTRAMTTTQLVPIAKNASYDFECYVRTQNLNSGGTPVVQILDAGNYNLLASTEAAPSGDNDWRRLSTSFKTGTDTEAVIIKIVRAPCGEGADNDVCPIFGALWYDDFTFKRTE